MTFFDGYEEHELVEMVRLIQAAGRKSKTKDIKVDADELEDELGDILVATGLCFSEGEAGIVWADAAGDELSHRKLRDAALRAAEAENPLEPGVLPRELRARLGGLMRTRWASRWRREGRSLEPRPADIDWIRLEPTERDEVRAMLRAIAQFESQFVHKGRPRRGDVDTAMRLIGDLFVGLTGQEVAIENLPSNEESHFIRFASIALRAVVDESALAPKALARRWMRHKKLLKSLRYSED